MSIDKSDFNGIYEELIELLGLEVTIKIHKYLKGQQVNFPMRLHSKAYVMKELQDKSVSDSKEIAKRLGYTDNWIRKLLKKIEMFIFLEGDCYTEAEGVVYENGRARESYIFNHNVVGMGGED
ncbi:hypothetical protein CNEO2_890001 [Clostridium neonatale]|uniref:hypothetical protein n=1 Tax=Clostridium neonatale TaxID=137838 RepID=UPI00291BFDD3|nr:hypothetical protein [Clostridium neonatale]CAI3249132.1 hypothetical protein CNEO2_890001 [Clostridium neonatale]